MSIERFDVAVAGGGLTGLVAAACFARAGRRVVIVEAREWGGEGDGRVSAITVASERILRRLGAWERITGAQPFRHIRVWEASGGAEIHFAAEAVGADHLGHIVENRVIAGALEAVVARLGVAWRRPSRVGGLALGRGEVIVDLGPSRLAAGLLVGADGGSSRVRRLVGIAARGRDYGQLGIVCTVRPEVHHGEVARQVAHPSGPLAFLPLPDGLCSIVWSTELSRAEYLLALADEPFRRALESAFEGRLGGIEWCGPRAGFPLRWVRSARYCASRVALVGDAAQSIHPLAGQGVNLGILDGAVLAEVSAEAAERGRDPGGRAVLEGYERRRRTHHAAVHGAVDGFDRLFRARGWPIRLARNAGLAATHRLPPVKNLIIRHASGLDGDLPAVAAAGRRGWPDEVGPRGTRSRHLDGPSGNIRRPWGGCAWGRVREPNGKG